jgi:ribosomal protein L12E/L44/L45/RPP1/RPP2
MLAGQRLTLSCILHAVMLSFHVLHCSSAPVSTASSTTLTAKQLGVGVIEVTEQGGKPTAAQPPPGAPAAAATGTATAGTAAAAVAEATKTDTSKRARTVNSNNRKTFFSEPRKAALPPKVVLTY